MNKTQLIAQLQFSGASIIDRHGNAASRDEVIALLTKQTPLSISEIGRRTFFIAPKEQSNQTFGLEASYIVLLPLDCDLQASQPLSA